MEFVPQFVLNGRHFQCHKKLCLISDKPMPEINSKNDFIEAFLIIYSYHSF